MSSSGGDTGLVSFTARSFSASSLSSSVDTSALDIEDFDLMDCLVQDVRNLSESLNRLSGIIEGCESTTQSEETQAYCIQVHKALTDVSKILKDLLDRYQFLRCSEVLSPASNLIHCVKGLKFDDVSNRSEDKSFQRALDSTQKLQVAVAERVGDYLTWEMSHYESSFVKLSPSNDDMNISVISHSYHNNLKNRTASSSSMNSSNGAIGNEGNHPRGIHRRHSTFQTKTGQDQATTDQMDVMLGSITEGVELAFNRAKAWSKYCKEVLQFVQRRINLETSHAKEVQKLAEQTRGVIQDEEYLPLQSIYVNSFKIEVEFFENCTDTMKRLYEYKFVKPLESRKNEHDKKRKDLKTLWDKHCKLVADTRTELRKAKQNFQQRESAYKKARETSVKTEMASMDKSKIDKRRKVEEDSMLKREQALKDVQNLEKRLEERQTDLERIKTRILRELRELIYQCDQTTKACTVAYFQALSGLWALLPMQYQTLSDSSRAYVPGMEYMQFVQALPKLSDEQDRLGSLTRKSRAISNDDLSLLPQFRKINGGNFRTPGPEIRHFPQTGHNSFPNFSPLMSGKTGMYGNGDYDESPSIHSSYSEVNFEPAPMKPGLSRTHSDGERRISDAAKSHCLEKVRMPAKCCHCDSLTFFQTIQCSACGMTWHKNCLGRMDAKCDPGAIGSLVRSVDPSKMSIYGVSLQEHLKSNQRKIPIVMERCIEELDSRGALVKGLYRVCGVKSKIEQLCEEFERKHVDLSNVHPTNIASVIKLYLRQLPQPLLTEELYSDFLHISKNFSQERESQFLEQKDFVQQACVAELKHVISKLPQENYDCLKYLVLHLKRMTWFEAENQMSAMNMGIVFGPTLMWREEKGAPLNSLLEAPLQTRVAELIIRFAYEIFQVDAAEERKKYYEKCAGKAWNSSEKSEKTGSLRGLSHPHRPKDNLHRSHTTTLGSHHSNSGTSLFIPTSAEQFRRKSEGISGSDRSPGNSDPDSGCDQESDAGRMRNSATPDLLKSRPKHERPPSSPNSSADGSGSPGAIHDHSLSNEDLTSAVLREADIISKKYNSPRLSDDLDHLSIDDEHRDDKNKRSPRKLSAPVVSSSPSMKNPEFTRSGRRFERGRPIRRVNSKPRNSYATSIFVNSPTSSYDNLSQQSADLTLTTSNNGDNDSNCSQLDYGSSSSSSELSIAEQKKRWLARDLHSETGTLRIVLESAPAVSSGSSKKNIVESPSKRDEGFESKSEDSLDRSTKQDRSTKEDRSTKQDSVRLLLSADPEDLSYV